MKKAGIFIFVLGVLATIYTGINFFTREKIADLGVVEITGNKAHHFTWSPIVGIGLIIIGAILFFFGGNAKFGRA
jgi:hypothetical protein